ncbi:MAG: hypothetical protein Q8L48_42175 [Archangium sp.]|nr:hypothetical protein [Archangium sp.]
MSRQSTLIFALVGLSLGLAWYMSSQRAPGPHPLAQCLTHDDCDPPERCVVVPKGDGFASFGQCGPPCVDDAGCPNGWTCRRWVDEKGFLSPEAGRPAEFPRVLVCAHHLVK